MQNVCPIGYIFFFQTHKDFALAPLEKNVKKKGSFLFNLQAFDKYVHSNGRYGLKTF